MTHSIRQLCNTCDTPLQQQTCNCLLLLQFVHAHLCCILLLLMCLLVLLRLLQDVLLLLLLLISRPLSQMQAPGP